MWIVEGPRLRSLRKSKRLTVAALAEAAGIGVRTLERLEQRGGQSKPETVDCIAQVLSRKPTDFAMRVPDDTEALAPTSPKADAKSPPARPSLLKPTKLETDVLREHLAGRSTPAPRGGLPVLTAKLLQDIYTVYLSFHGAQVWLFGRVISQRGIGKQEAALIGGVSGRSARFLVGVDVLPDLVLTATVHVPDGADARRLQGMLGGAAAWMRVEVATLGDDWDEVTGFSSFVSEKPRPWTFVLREL